MDGVINFHTNPNIIYVDIGKEDEERKIGMFLRDIRFDTGVGNKRSKIFKTIKRLFEVGRNRYLGRGLTNPNNSIESQELLILETKDGPDGFLMKR